MIVGGKSALMKFGLNGIKWLIMMPGAVQHQPRMSITEDGQSTDL
jgi:hypothetical protein